MRRFFRLTFSRVLFFCLFCGMLAGTIGTNLLADEILGHITDAGALSLAGAGLDREQKGQLLRYVFRLRMAEFGTAALVGMTPLSALGFSVFAFAGGMCCGVLLTAETLRFGIGGIASVCRILMPQWLFYLPVWIVLAVKSEDGLEQMKFRVWAVLPAAALAGVFSEAYINPYLWKF